MRRVRFIILPLIIFLSITAAESQSIDFFPLAVGNHWAYDYSLDLQEYYFHTRDSGTATYTIVSKVSNIDSTIWALMEIRDGVRTRSSIFDTSVVTKVLDSTAFSLIEYDSAYHRFVTVGYPDGWPGNRYKTVFLFFEELSDSTIFFRYLPDLSPDTVSNQRGFYHQWGLTVSFQRNRGPIDLLYWKSGPHYDFAIHGTLREALITRVDEPADPHIPKAFNLLQNYPNPFNPTTSIQFTLAQSEFVTLEVFDLAGRQVTILVSKNLPVGTHLIEWSTRALSSGIYFYRIQAGTFTETKKLVLLR